MSEPQANELIIFNRVMENITPLIDEKIEDKTEYKTTLKVNKIKAWVVGIFFSVIVAIVGGAFFIGGLASNTKTRNEKLDEFISSQKLSNEEFKKEIKSTYDYIDSKIDPMVEKQNSIITNQVLLGVQAERMDPKFKASFIRTRGHISN